MKGLLQNKKNLLPILLGIVIIIVAVVTFFIIKSKNKKEDRITTINFPRNQVADTENAIVDNTVENEVGNETENTVDDGDNDNDEDKDFGIDEKYQKAAKEFAKALVDENKMEEFLDGDFFDPIAFVAYDISDSDSDFLDTYSQLNLNEEERQEIKEKFLDLVDNEREIKITNMLEPVNSEEDENISFLFTTLEIDGEEKDIILVYYADVIVFISDESRDSIFDSDIL